MSCKYDIIDEGGRKRVRALRPFTVQGRDVCPMELGGYVYDANTLSQDGNCWIFSGSLEYPGVRVMDEAIVDMGINLPKNNARPKATIISGNSRIMGAISFETQSFGVSQTPAMFEQGTYNVVVGSVPIKTNASTRVRIKVPTFAGTVGNVAITSTAYEARLISLNEAGIIVSATAWTVGGPAVTLTSTAPYILVDIRKVGETAISPADVTAAGITITQAREATVRIFNSSIVPVYNGVVTLATSILRYEVTDPSGKPYQVNIQNSYLHIECVFNATNVVRANADFIRVNYNLVLSPNVSHYISGTYRNTNINTPDSVGVAGYTKSRFDVSDCPNFEFSTVTFPDLASMYSSSKTFYFNQCNMPAASALIYYDAKVNTWDNIDFTKVEPNHLGEALSTEPNTILVSSNVQGMFRLYRNADDKVFGPLVEHLESVFDWEYGALESSYDSVIYKDCTISGKFDLFGRNVFGGTLGGKSTVTNTGADVIDINGNFRIEGNAQVTDTPLRGTGYVGDNAELKNCKVEGYIYMAENAKAIPEVVPSTPIFRNFIASGNSRYLVHRAATTAPTLVILELRDNATVAGPIALSGRLVMRDNALIQGTGLMINVSGYCEMRENATVKGTAALTVAGSSVLIGNFLIESGNQTIYGNRTLSDVSQIGETELPPMKQTW